MTTFELKSHSLAYDHLLGTGPCVIFCAGFNSNRFGNKAQFLKQQCQQQGREFICFDYYGHGESTGDFADGSISVWRNDVLTVLNEIMLSDQCILVGSSMGGWLALLAAMHSPARVGALLLMACAADMTRFYPARLEGLSQQYDTQSRAYYSVPNAYDDQQPYRVYQHLIDDGEQWSVLDQAIEISVPIRLMHGMRDDVVDWQRSAAVLEQVNSQDASLELIKSGDHRLSSVAELTILQRTLSELSNKV